MSTLTSQNYVYQFKGRDFHLYRVSHNLSNLPDQKGRFSYYPTDLIYPDESITAGIRIEYTAPIDTFIDIDPSVLATDASETSWTNPTFIVHTKGHATNPITELSHVNLNRMLSLAVVDYIRAMLYEKAGSVDLKAYYMQQFFKKLGDNDSNKRKIRITFAKSPYALR